ncbi:hypothetical protein Fmac_031234 [Flemingia macrophylla]|uniref:Uncharacterized protein n=1 Tax=Flemingia macrophylla TaxID=520843 RepID=A0ABD1L1X7_9FABA
MEKARKGFYESVKILKDSFLLLHASKENVKMHDMVRDVALQITSKMGQAILTSNLMDLRKLVEDENIKDKKEIYIWDLKNSQVLNDDHLNCLSPSLEILVLQSLKVGLEVSNASLEKLKKLKVLAFLTHGYHWYQIPSLFTLSLPHSLGSLENLHTLCLRGYKLGSISILESLRALEILDLRGSSFEELPNGIVELKKLKLVDLYDCQIIKNNAFKVTEGCLQLEELYLCPLFEEEIIPHDVPFLSKLQRKLGLGSYPKLVSLFMPCIVQTLEQLEVLNIHDCNDLKHIIEQSEEKSADYFPKLKSLDIGNFKELEYILGLAKLEEVNIRDNCNLKYVFGRERNITIKLIFK